MPEPAVPTTVRPIVRSHGDSGEAYRAAHDNAIVIDRADRAVIHVGGRDPVKMIHGLVSNDVQNLAEGDATYATLLTPKGRMVADLRVVRRADHLLLEMDAAAAPGALAHLRKYVPPLFARARDASSELAVLGVYGPAGARLLARAIRPGLPAAGDADGDNGAVSNAGGRQTGGGEAGGDANTDTTIALLEGLGVDRAAAVSVGGAPATAIRTGYAGVPGWDVLLPADRLDALQNALVSAGAVLAGHAVLDVLRIEAGQPRWGAELNEDVFPLEAGLEDRAISTTKGCYTGQEVIIRILHRGHVNRHLRGLLLGDVPTPAAGTELFREGQQKAVGHVTSACLSPALGQTIALGYVRREIEIGQGLRVGAPDGVGARVVSLPFGGGGG